MKFCIRQDIKEVKDLAEQLNLPVSIIASKVAVFMEKNNNYDVFPTAEQLSISSKSSIEQFNEKEVGNSYSLMNGVWKKELDRIRKTYGIEPNVIKDNYSVRIIGAKDLMYSLASEKNRSLTMIDSILSKLGIFDTYFRNNEESDNKLKEILTSQGLTNEEIDYIFDLEQTSEKKGNNISYLLTQEYSKYTSGDVVIQRMNKLKNLKFDNALESKLIEFGKSLGIDYEVIDNMKGKFGVDALGVADILNKMIYVAKERKMDTFAEEIAHFYVECLGHKEGLGLNLFNKIEYWSGYQEVYDNYSSVYLHKNGTPDLVKIKKEAVGQAIAEAILKNYVSNSESYPQEEKDFWKTIVDAIKDFLKKFKAKSYIPLETLTNDIAEKILSNDISQIQNRIANVANKNKELKTYDKTLENYPLATQVINSILSMGGVLTGSLALRKQGTIFRNENETVHDLDFSIDYPSWNGDYLKFLTDFKTLYPNYYALSNEPYFGNGGEYVFNGVITDDPELFKRFKAEKGNFNDRLDKFTLEEQSQMLLIDFFFNPEGFTTKNINGLQSADVVFNAKSVMGMRDKDVFDLINYAPYDQPTELSEYTYLQLPSTRPSNTLTKLQQSQFKNALIVDEVIAFDYWSENSMGESNKNVLVTGIDKDRFYGTYIETGEKRIFKYSNIINNSVEGTISIPEIFAYRRNLTDGKEISIETINGLVEGVIESVGSSGFTVDGVFHNFRDIISTKAADRLQTAIAKVKENLAQKIEIFSKNANNEYKQQRLANLQQALEDLEGFTELTDLVGFFEKIKKQIDITKAMIENMDKDPVKMLSSLSFINHYLKSFTNISDLIKLLPQGEIKEVGNGLLISISEAQDAYKDKAIPSLGAWLWEHFPHQLNAQLASVGKDPYTLENIIEELQKPSSDIDNFNKFGVPIGNSNDILLGLFSKTIDNYLQKQQTTNLKLENKLADIIETLKSKGIDFIEASKSFYKLVEERDEEGNKKLYRQFITKYDLGKFYSEQKRLREKRNNAYKINAENKSTANYNAYLVAKNEYNKYMDTYGNKLTDKEMYDKMEKLKGTDDLKYDDLLLYNYTRSSVGKSEYDIRISEKVTITNELGEDVEIEEVFYYNYKGNFYEPKKDLKINGEYVFINKEYEALEKGNPAVFELYQTLYYAYKTADKALPYHKRLRGRVPVAYKKGLGWNIKARWQNFWKIGNSNTTEDLTETKDLIQFDGEPYKVLSMPFTKRIEDSLADENIIFSTFNFISNSNFYKAKNENLGAIDIFLDTLNTQPEDGTGKGRKSKYNNRKDSAIKFVEQVIYNELGETGVGTKLIDALGKSTAILNMAFSTSAITNSLMGNLTNAIEGLGGRNYSIKNLANANKLYASLLTTNKDKLDNILDSLGAIQGKFGEYNKLKTKSSMINLSAAFFLQDAGEHQIQGSAALALLDAMKVTIPADGIFTEDLLPPNFLGILHEMNKSNHGVYNSFDRLYLQDQAMFRLFLQFRKWVIPTFRARFSGLIDGEYRIDVQAGTVERGYYRAFYEYVKERVTSFEKAKNLFSDYKNLSAVDKEGVIRSMQDINSVLLLTALLWAYGYGDDEDEEDFNKFDWAVVYQMKRLRSEQLSYWPILGLEDQGRMINEPFAAWGFAEKLFDIGKLTVSCLNPLSDKSFTDEYERKSSFADKGDNKFFYKLQRINPIFNLYKATNPEIQLDNFDKISN
jgi:hypothetical protein